MGISDVEYLYKHTYPYRSQKKQLLLGGPIQSLKDQPVIPVLGLMALFHCSVPWLCCEVAPPEPDIKWS